MIPWFNNHSFIKAHTSSPSKCRPWSIKPCKMSWYQCVQSFSIGVFSLCVCVYFFCVCVNVWTEKCVFCVCVVPKAYQLGLSLTSSPYMRSVCAKGKSGESDLYIVWHPCPRIPLHHGCQTPTDGKSASAQHAPTGHTLPLTHTHTTVETHTGNVHKEKLEAHTHTYTPKGREGRKVYCYGWERHEEVDLWASESVWCCYGWHLAVRESVATQMPRGLGLLTLPSHLLLPDGKDW